MIRNESQEEELKVEDISDSYGNESHPSHQSKHGYDDEDQSFMSSQRSMASKHDHKSKNSFIRIKEIESTVSVI